MAINPRVEAFLKEELDVIRSKSRSKHERVMDSPQGAEIQASGRTLINLCSNNYLGFADDPEIAEAVSNGLKTHGYGIASARFICGTQGIHKRLEQRISEFFGTDDAILYNSCFDANLGLFEPLLGSLDCIISDDLNHASIIDGIRLCKAKRKVYQHSDMRNLEEKLDEARQHRIRLIVTDGVFSMEGDVACLPEICELSERYEALVAIDDSHATGLLGPTGRGTAELYGVQDRIDVITSTFGKALGGASGGFATGRKKIIDILRQRSRPYLFSNSVAPPMVIGAMKALDLIEGNPQLIQLLEQNSKYFRQQMAANGFKVSKGIHPIVPIILGDEQLTLEMAKRLNELGVLVVGFTHPVVPPGQARIRVQLSSSHTREQLDIAVAKFVEVAQALNFRDV